MYVTNQPDIVAYAKYCYLNYPTIVNNIPKEKNSYNNTLFNFALIDNNLAAAQRAIGESSNLAQIALTYTYNFSDKKYQDFVCILSVLAQVAIDNAKRRFDINLTEEIKRIKLSMDLKENGYPSFWGAIRKTFNKDKIVSDLKCPMNYIFNIKNVTIPSSDPSLPMNHFFVKYELTEHTRKCKKVEELIEKYSLKLKDFNTDIDDDNMDEFLLLRDDFDQLIEDIRSVYISKNYLGLMSWLINRAFLITPGIKTRKNDKLTSTIKKNKSLLLKVLYTINSDSLLKCFSNNIEK